MPEITATTHPEDNGAAGKTFTQEEVNRIVADRLAREREKTQQPTIDEREQALKARENKLECREYLKSKGYPEKIMEVLDTSDLEKFKTGVETLKSTFPNSFPQVRTEPPATPPSQYVDDGVASKLKDAFKPKFEI